MILNQKSIFYFRLISDLFLLNLSFIAACVLAQSWEILLQRNYMFILMMALNLIWIFSSSTSNFYGGFNSRNFAYQFVILLKIIIPQAVASVIFIFLIKEDLFTRNFVVYFLFLLAASINARILAFKLILKNLRKRGKHVRNILIIGAGEVGRNFNEVLKKNPDFGYKLAGFLDDSVEAVDGEKVIGKIDELESQIIKAHVEEVIISLPEFSEEKIEQIIRICNRNAVRIHIIPDYFKYVSKKFQVSMIGNFPVITARAEPLEEINWRFIKRVFDLLFSIIVLLTIFSWLFPIIVLLIKLNSAGSAIYIQERIGVKNRKFKCYKFRTLVTADDNENIRFKPVTENDPRITSFGNLLRKSNLDEMPQFFNVLRGDMSLVGPRPHAIPYDEKYSKIFEKIRLRHIVKPGITGWAQIHGLRGDVEDETENEKRTIKRMEYDLWYIENWSFLLDIQIILVTVWQMIRRDTKAI
jgi:putative colanic acid biosynthesis UDP-glucose lipid carrier transferase